MRKNTIGVILLVLFASCEKEKITVPVESEILWQEDERFLFDLKVQFNSCADTTNLYLLGRENFSHIQLKDSTEEVSHSVLGINYNQNHKMPITPRLFLAANYYGVEISPSINPVLANASFFFLPKEADSTFLDFAFPPFWLSEAMLINARGECLIPYSYPIDPSQGNYGLKVFLVTTSIRGQYKDLVDILKTESFTISEQPSVEALHCIDDDFYIVDHRSTIKIDDAHTPRTVSNVPLYRIFKVDNILYGLSNENLYTSGDGEDWSFVGNLDYVHMLMNYSSVGDSTIAYYNSQLFHLRRANTGLTITELSNEGLYGNEITSVSAFHGKVYVTTLSGVFHKNYDDFWIEKKE